MCDLVSIDMPERTDRGSGADGEKWAEWQMWQMNAGEADGGHPPSGERNKLLMVSRLAQNGSLKKIFVLPCAKMFVLLQPFSARWKTPEERCRSGRSGRSRKPLTSLLVPGFESLSLRKQCKEPKMICLWLYFFIRGYRASELLTSTIWPSVARMASGNSADAWSSMIWGSL